MVSLNKRKQSLFLTLVRELTAYTSSKVVIRLLLPHFSHKEIIGFGFQEWELEEALKNEDE